MLWTIASIALGFYPIHYFLTRYPKILHLIHKPAFAAKHISHRGGAGESVENTLDAFKRAINCGTDMLELDVHLTKDNEVVVAHDSELARAFCARQTSTIEDVNFRELPLYKEEIELTFYPGHFHRESDPLLRRIPKLEDIFSAFPGVPINLDIKFNDDVLIDKVACLIESFNREKITVWGSFSQEVSNKCFRRNPTIPRFFPFRDAVLYILYFHLGLLTYMKCHYTHMELPSLSIMLWVTDFVRLLFLIQEKVSTPSSNDAA
ncbi:hypothetical protein Ciccas_005145 [Cichlidogyrus casuarinus]|uniref:GP-PDE domain-containing protein n=1 Tax=Cichlidogyrus casuarinus TaxID=1844966 RepID=A0ABD2Q9H5_9PLAT